MNVKQYFIDNHIPLMYYPRVKSRMNKNGMALNEALVNYDIDLRGKTKRKCNIKYKVIYDGKEVTLADAVESIIEKYDLPYTKQTCESLCYFRIHKKHETPQQAIEHLEWKYRIKFNRM